jgi:hypothetical protein
MGGPDGGLVQSFSPVSARVDGTPVRTMDRGMSSVISSPYFAPVRRLGMGEKTLENIIAFGGIADCSQMGLRSSERLKAQPMADATQMERAMLLAQRRDEPVCSGTAPTNPYSVLNFSDDDILSRAADMGVSLGVSAESKLGSIKLIKDTEVHRSLTLLKKTESTSESNIADPNNLVVSNISALCEDLVEEESDNMVAAEAMVSTLPRMKTKKNYDTGAVRRSKRIKILKNNKSKNARP